MSAKISQTAQWSGKMVFAKVDGKEDGPFYCFQVIDGVATLNRGSEEITVKAEDVIREK